MWLGGRECEIRGLVTGRPFMSAFKGEAGYDLTGDPSTETNLENTMQNICKPSLSGRPG